MAGRGSVMMSPYNQLLCGLLSLACCTRDGGGASDAASGGSTANGTGSTGMSGTGTGGGAADSAGPAESEFPLREIEQLPAVERGTPAGQLVYDLGTGPDTYSQAIHVDEDGLYWAQKTGIYRGSHDGTKEPEFVARCNGACDAVLDSDAEHLYWLSRGSLNRRSKAMAPEEAIPLQWDHTGGDALVGEKFVYTAMPGCPSITRIDKQTLEQDFTYQTLSERGVGGTQLSFGPDGALYCASWSRIFRVVEWGKGEVLYDEASRLEGLGFTDSHIVWLDRNLDRSLHSRVGRMPLKGGEAELFPQPISGPCAGGVFDSGSNKFIFVKGSWVTEFDVSTSRFTYVARDAVVMLRVWKGDMYWILSHAYDARRDAEWGGIRKLPVTTQPIFIFD